MSVGKDQVFLFQGRYQEQIDHPEKYGSEIIQYVLVAQDAQAASDCLKEAASDFVVLGYSSVKEYEETLAKIQAAIKGENIGWPVLVQPRFA